ncbi:MAG: hypothetical protein V4633_11820 [Pseudomonadota bacterium]
MAILKRIGAIGMLALVAGCATISESNRQILVVHTIEDNREIVGAGCVLTNDAGRWFVTSPGRVMVQKSAGNLWIDCKKGNASIGQDMVSSRANGSATIGNAVFTAGLGYLMDKRTGAGFDYPDTLTVLMRRTGRNAEPERSESSGNVVY